MTTTTELLLVSGLDSAAISATAEARGNRNALLVKGRAVTRVASAAGVEMAGETLRDIKAFTRSIEDARQAVKAPVLTIGSKIDALARDLTTDLLAEADRIARLVGAYQSEQYRIAEEARRKAWDEEQRIKAEANAKIAEAEAHSRTQASFEKKAEKIEAQATQQIIDTRVAAAAAIPPKPAGFSTRRDPKYEVTDIVALYEACPFLVKMEPNHAALIAAIKGLTGEQTLPGVKHWFESKAVVR